jgi:hypothetical protein
MSAGTLRVRMAEHVHTIEVDEGGCWTLTYSFPPRR